MGDPVYLLPFLFPVFLGLFWAGVVKLLSVLSGWGSLNRVYARKGIFRGETMYMRSARMGLINYNACLTIGINGESLFLGVMILFKIGHRDLVVPLADIRGNERKGFIFRHIELSFKGVPGVKMRISKQLADTLEKRSRNAWKYGRLQSQ